MVEISTAQESALHEALTALDLVVPGANGALVHG